MLLRALVGRHLSALELAFIDLQDALADLLGCRVDLNASASLSPYFRHDVLKEAEPVYVSA